jgi:hypothetical protein
MAKAHAADIPDGLPILDELARREERMQRRAEARNAIRPPLEVRLPLSL